MKVQVAEADAKRKYECFGSVPALLFRWYLLSNPFKDTTWDVIAARERARFQRMRHAFLLRPLDPKRPQELPPQDLDFVKYLLDAHKPFGQDLLHFGVSQLSHLFWAIFLLFEVATLLDHVAIYMFFACGWGLLLAGIMAQQHYEWIVMELMPIKDLSHMDEELERLRGPSTSIFFQPYQKVHSFIRKVYGRRLPPMVRDASTERNASIKSMGEKSGREFLHKGRYNRRRLPPGLENKQTILFLGVKKSGHGRGNPMATKAMQAAVLLMQRILLASAIYLTIIIVYLTPAFTWDWKVAGLALPVAMLSIKVVTSITPLMMLSLYTETFANKNVVDSLIEASKLEKIAKAAKLLHAMRSRALILRARLSGLRKKEEAKALPTYDELMKTLEGDKRKKAIDLKEAFDKFDTYVWGPPFWMTPCGAAYHARLHVHTAKATCP
eukprot:4850662-Prymnesium_polylepis.2